jgi:diguanylate cyclase (GGDEF)-like protein/putative nucleotidyltransferase with HDIG domain
MSELSRSAKVYIGLTLSVALVVAAWNLTRLDPQEAWLLLVVSAVAAAAQVFKVEGSTQRSSYNISWMAYGFAFVRLGVPAAMFVILVSHVVEWIFHKYPWYIQLFNIGTYLLAAQAAETCLGPAIASSVPLPLLQTIAILAAMAIFTLVNHLLVGIVIWLARGENLVKSGVFGPLTLMIDFSLLCLGIGAALVWVVNPFAVVTVAIPLYLLYSTLRVPALERQTDTDPKTGLFNARYLREALEKERSKAQRFERPLTVVMADLDLLRNINNSYGHLAGDTVLCGVAEILQRSVRTYDVVARFGGEEFVILMPEVAPEEALSRLEVIRRAIEEAAFQVATDIEPIHATMSFGVAGLEHPDQTVEQILHNADLAVYYSKLNGRNRISLQRQGQSRLAGGASQPGEPARAFPSTASAGAAAGPPQVFPQPAAPAPAAPAPGTSAEASGEPKPLPTPTVAVATPPAPMPVTLKPAPLWLVNVYIGGLATVALAQVVLMLRLPPGLDWIGLGVFAVLALLSEGLAIDIYVKDTSVSLATVPLVAGTLLFGPMGAVALSLVLAFTAGVKHHSPQRNFVFNLSNHLIGSLGCLAILRLAGIGLSAYPVAVQLILVMVSAGVIFLSTTLLVALVVRLDTGRQFQQIWLERFAWLWPYYIGMGAVAYTLMYSYGAVGLFGVAAVILPLAVLRYSQQLYLDRTKAMVKQLRAANDNLLKQTKEVATLNEELLTALAHSIDLRDPNVLGHSQHVARYAVLIARELGLPPERVELVRKGGLLHDIGKLSTPEAILFKPGTLNSEEYARMKEHSALGADIIANCHSLYELVSIVRHHHERYDGGGYPDHLWAHDIPLEARILAVADAVEAMASDRPYRRGMDASAILDEIQRQASTQFDPEVTTAFWNVVRKSSTPVIINSARGAQPTPDNSSAATVLTAARRENPAQFEPKTASA